jgi:hypothetical protein
MPINQSRLITQNNAALLSFQAIERIRTFLQTQQTRINQGLMSPAVAFAELGLFITDNDQLFPPSIPGFAPDLRNTMTTFSKIEHVIMEEWRHFNRNAARNATKAEYMRTARNASNPRRNRRLSQPHSIFEASIVIAPSNQPPPISQFNDDPARPYGPKDGELTPEQEQALLDDIAARTGKPRTPFENQTPSSQSIWTPPTLKPEDDEVFEPINSEEQVIPPTGRQPT